MRRVHVVFAWAAVVVTSPVVTWWITPDLSEAVGSDYVVKPPDLSPTAELAIGLAATLLLAVAAVVLLSRTGRANTRSTDIRVVSPLVAVGAFIGFGYCVMTLRGDGANIGAGFIFMVGVVFVPVMILLSVFRAVQAER